MRGTSVCAAHHRFLLKQKASMQLFWETQVFDIHGSTILTACYKDVDCRRLSDHWSMVNPRVPDGTLGFWGHERSAGEKTQCV